MMIFDIIIVCIENNPIQNNFKISILKLQPLLFAVQIDSSSQCKSKLKNQFQQRSLLSLQPL